MDERTRELQTANDQLRELDQIKSAFVSIVSHELRTPMTSIKGLVENLMDGLVGELTERQTFYLSRVRANVDRLTRMIHDLLDLSRIESGRMDLSATTLSMAELISDITESLQVSRPLIHSLFQIHRELFQLLIGFRVVDGDPNGTGDRHQQV